MNLVERLFGSKQTQPEVPGAAPPASMGMYTECELPQDPRAGLLRQIVPAMTGPPGIRLARPIGGAGRYFGTDGLPPLRFPLSGPPHVNQPVDLEQAIYKPNK